jgi:hypothetical protein
MDRMDRMDRAGEDRAGEDRAGEDRAGEDRAGEDRAGEDRAGEDSNYTYGMYVCICVYLCIVHIYTAYSNGVAMEE